MAQRLEQRQISFFFSVFHVSFTLYVSPINGSSSKRSEIPHRLKNNMQHYHISCRPEPLPRNYIIPVQVTVTVGLSYTTQRIERGHSTERKVNRERGIVQSKSGESFPQPLVHFMHHAQPTVFSMAQYMGNLTPAFIQCSFSFMYHARNSSLADTVNSIKTLIYSSDHLAYR